jgi:hypothetical protein
LPHVGHHGWCLRAVRRSSRPPQLQAQS